MRLPGSSDSRWALAWLLCLLAVLLLLGATRSHAQSDPKPPPQSIEQSLLDSLTYCGMLEAELQQQKLRLEGLQKLSGDLKIQLLDYEQIQIASESKIASLRDELMLSRESVATWQRESTALSESLAKSEEQSKKLSSGFESYKVQRDRDVAGLEGQLSRSRIFTRILLCSTVVGIGTTLIFAFR